LADADGDGIPNGWEQAHGVDPFNPLDAQADNDGDGMSNLQEYLAGTNATNSASCFRITSQVLAGKDVRVSWTSVGGKSGNHPRTGAAAGDCFELLSRLFPRAYFLTNSASDAV
jgi:hypothetical protein